MIAERLTHDEHLQVAAHVRAARNHLMAARRLCLGRLPAGLLGLLGRTAAMDKLRSKLDDEYHKVTSDAQFKKHGNVYYSSRWKSL